MILELLITAIVSYLAYQKWNFNYWKRRSLEFIEPKLFLGNVENPFSRKYSIGMWMKKLYDELKARGLIHGGIFLLSHPAYLPTDPEILKNVMLKDFPHFVDRGFYFNEKNDPLSANLFAIGGQKWRNLRTKLTPTFTSSKMKMMFETLLRCGLQMQDALEPCNPVEIKDVLARFTTDIIGSCAFGIDCNSFKYPDAEFRRYGKKVFAPVSRLTGLKNMFSLTYPTLARRMGILMFRRDATTFFMRVVKDTLEYRKKHGIVRKDMLQILIDLQKDEECSRSEGKALSEEEIAAQAFVFFIAGFETSSTTMAYALFEMASNPDIQRKVRDEIDRVLAGHDNKITYEAIMEMKYMQQVIDETLRKYPPIPFVSRECVMDYNVPKTELLIEKGTKVIISILGLHRDPDNFPEPERFDPERFSDKNRHKIKPFSYIPFGEGPRLCIGMRFGLMQTKVGLAILLRKFAFSVNPQTIVPLAMNAFSFMFTNEGGIWLDVEDVKK